MPLQEQALHEVDRATSLDVLAATAIDSTEPTKSLHRIVPLFVHARRNQVALLEFARHLPDTVQPTVGLWSLDQQREQRSVSEARILLQIDLQDLSVLSCEVDVFSGDRLGID